MSHFAKYFTVLCATLLFGCAADGADRSAQGQESEFAQWRLLDEYESSMRILAGFADYGSASRVALAVAYERHRLEGMTLAVCEALSQSRQYQRLASAGRSREDFHVLTGIQERTGAMVPERAMCDHAQAALARGTSSGF